MVARLARTPAAAVLVWRMRPDQPAVFVEEVTVSGRIQATSSAEQQLSVEHPNRVEPPSGAGLRRAWPAESWQVGHAPARIDVALVRTVVLRRRGVPRPAELGQVGDRVAVLVVGTHAGDVLPQLIVWTDAARHLSTWHNNWAVAP